MEVILENIQDTPKNRDTAKIIMMYKLFPATKIESREGAIIPKEAVQMVKLVPSIPAEKEEPISLLPYVLYGVVILVVLVAIKRNSNKRKRPSI